MNWKSIKGYEGLYEVSDTGLIRSLKRGRKRNLSPKKHPRGYLQVALCKDGKAKGVLIHRLVAEAFIPNPLGLPTVNHIDKNKLNNAAANLEWMTTAENNRYSFDKSVLQLDQSGNVVNQFPSIREAGRQTGVAVCNISQVCNGIRKSAGGYIWRYA